MHVTVTGDRHWAAVELAEAVLNRLRAEHGPDLTIVHGGAAALDNAFRLTWQKLGVQVQPYRAKWKGLGGSAGPARNRDMV